MPHFGEEHPGGGKRTAGYGVFITPGLVVDGEVKLAGKVATKNQIKKILSE
jgi:hypothetical protein